MQMDFHYYATYAAAVLAGYSHEEALDIAYSAQFVDECTTTLLGKLEASRIAATTQLSMELVDAKTDIMGLQDITRIWSSFHFLPKDLYAPKKKGCGKLYMNKYRLICGPNGALVKDTVDNAKRASATGQPDCQAIGIAMHVVADTWAHMHFAGTPSLAINNTNDYFYEMFDDGTSRQISFKRNPITPDDLERSAYTASMYQSYESNIMNLGHGRAGLLTLALSEVPRIYVILYLSGVYIISGTIDILSALDARRQGSVHYKLKLTLGIINMLVGISCIALVKWVTYVVYIYAAGLIYNAIMRMINVFRKHEMVYIQ